MLNKKCLCNAMPTTKAWDKSEIEEIHDNQEKQWKRESNLRVAQFVKSSQYDTTENQEITQALNSIISVEFQQKMYEIWNIEWFQITIWEAITQKVTNTLLRKKLLDLPSGKNWS